MHRTFDPYTAPPNGAQARCHVLRPTERQALLDYCVSVLPGCYISQAKLRRRMAETGLPASEILANQMPDPGNVMSGDFGEILTLHFLASERTEDVRRIRKWRYKQDRLKPTPHSDVVVLHMAGNTPSVHDFVICAESKQKATPGSSAPIAKAIEGLKKDHTGRLGRTLAWLREKAIENESASTIRFISRFTHDITIEYAKHFKAVAVLERRLLNAELAKQPVPIVEDEYEVVVIGIPDLKEFYETVFQRALEEVQS